jgi:hypothetical protein
MSRGNDKPLLPRRTLVLYNKATTFADSDDSRSRFRKSSHGAYLLPRRDGVHGDKL